MSGHGLHVHGPDDHGLGHAAQHADKDSFAGLIAVLTKRDWLKWGVFGVAGLAMVLGVAALLHF